MNLNPRSFSCKHYLEVVLGSTDDAVSTAKQYSKQGNLVKDLETKDLVIVHKKCNFRDEVLESKVTKLTIRHKKKQS